MEELPDTEDTITKLKSSLPLCRVCLDVSMEYIEFEATLCVINNREITSYEAFHELFPGDQDLSHQNITHFCATCGKDLLNAYLFMKRIEHTNYVLSKVKNFTEENSKFLLQDHDDEGEDDYVQTGTEIKTNDVIYFAKQESECSKGNEETFIEDTENLLKNNGLNDSSNCDVGELIKEEELAEADCDLEYETICDSEFSQEEKDELLSEPETQLFLTGELDEVEYEDNIESTTAWISTECGNLEEKKEENLEQNEFDLHENYIIKCSHCDTFLNNKEMKSHVLKFHGHLNLDCPNKPTENNFNCNTNQTRQTSGNDNHKNLEYNKCPYCRRMIRRCNMEKHLLTHSAGMKKVFNCSVCDGQFPTKVGLIQHSHSHTNDRRRYACQKCGKICSKPFTLRNHMQAKHLSERRKHQCEDCGLFFLFPSNLKEHRRKHNMNNRFKCSHCDRTFVRKPQLDIHMRYHLNEFPYKCDQCDKCYVSKSNLTDHIRSKHTKTTYDCDRCKQKFKSQTGLRKHKYVHDGYPYNCPLCNVGQTSRSGMKQHLMGVHKDALTEAEFDIMFPIIIPKTDKCFIMEDYELLEIAVCRVCLKSTHDYMELDALMQNDEDDDPLTYLECFKSCTQLDIQLDDDQPKQICLPCSNELWAAYEFITKARVSHEVLITRQLRYEEVKSENGDISNEEQHEIDSKSIDIDTTEKVDEEVLYMSMGDNELVEEEVVESFQAENNFAEETEICESNKDKLELENQADDEVVSIDDFNEEDIIESVDSSLSTIKCNLCRQTFLSLNELREHGELEHENAQYCCQTCFHRFTFMYGLTDHIKRRHDTSYVKCNTCKTLVQSCLMRSHKRKEHANPTFLCTACPRTFKTSAGLQIHSETHKENRQRNFECEQCNKKFLTERTFKVHARTHWERKHFKCELCDKQFLQKINLKLHMQMHRGETMDCIHCEKKFVRKTDLTVHMRFHTGNFPYECPLCDKRFAIVSHLNYHKKRHQGYVYKCDVCEKEFINKSGLRNHSFQHTIMPFNCLLCDKGFPTKFKIKRHLKTVHHVEENENFDRFITKDKVKRETIGEEPIEEGMFEQIIDEKLEES
ncbi:zinc finger protein 62-like [Eupeodes corollae]|uniref:zinc finger protein 62-like n=1 Tax=Eupeodes corollae TaxID=290404 RepID=UPI00248F7F7B|nr:zinc finger protein 62-like [Eupeodes corollae]